MAGAQVARKFQIQRPIASAIASGLQILGGAYLIPTLKLNVPGRVNGEYDMTTIVTQAKTNWNLRGPVILDLSNVSSNGSPHVSPINSSELRSLVRALKEVNLVPIGVTNSSEDVKNMAWRTLQIPSIIGTRLEDDEELSMASFANTFESDNSDQYTAVTEETYTKEIDQPSNDTMQQPKVNGMMMFEGSVRTGQQVYAKGQGLIVMGSVNSGAEVLADGDIHVYGTLKGRALAGIGGNCDAKVYAQKFDAELISIADTFTTCDALEARATGDVVDDRPTAVWLENGELRFKSVVPGRA